MPKKMKKKKTRWNYKRIFICLGVLILLIFAVIFSIKKLVVDNRISSEALTAEEIDNIYKEVMKKELEHPRMMENKLYYTYGYIDDDTIPELFIGRDTTHVDPIQIYTIGNDKKPVYLGDFGEFGECEYIPNKNRIISSYGAMGSYHFFTSTINSKKEVELCETLLDASGLMMGNEKCYYGFPVQYCNKSFNGSIGSAPLDVNGFTQPADEFQISKEKCDEYMSKMREGAIRVNCNDMKNVYSK